jgi:nucleotide-binding universal stress UspA family protein
MKENKESRANILVLVNGTKVDDEVVKLACTTSKNKRSKVYVAYVIEVERCLPLDAEIEPEVKRGEELLNHAERIAGEQDCEVETDLLQAREAGPAIVDEAIERGVSLIVMGTEYKKQFGEFSLGETIPHVLKNAPCRVLVCREPIPLEEVASQ